MQLWGFGNQNWMNSVGALDEKVQTSSLTNKIYRWRSLLTTTRPFG